MKAINCVLPLHKTNVENIPFDHEGKECVFTAQPSLVTKLK